MGKSKDISGLVIGRLTVIGKNDDPRSKYTNKKGQITYKEHCDCQCECGNVVSIRKDNLIGPKKTYSCGCLQREAARRNGLASKKPKGVVPFNNIIYNYKHRAIEKKREFLLTEEQFREIINKDCFYCGMPPSNRYFNSKDSDDVFVYNGIDRINPKFGYNLENVVACCANCNYAKSDLTQEEFFNLIEKVYTRHVHKIIRS